MDLRGRHPCWLHPHLGTTVEGQAPHAYLVALRHVAVTLDAAPAWRRWWQASGVSRCELGIVTESHPERPSADICTLPGALRANFTCTVPAPLEHRPAELLPLAAHEVTGMLEVIRQVLALGPLPALPPLSEPPDPAAALEVTHRPLPDEGALSQIQEFFGEPPT